MTALCRPSGGFQDRIARHVSGFLERTGECPCLLLIRAEVHCEALQANASRKSSKASLSNVFRRRNRHPVGRWIFVVVYGHQPDFV